MSPTVQPAFVWSTQPYSINFGTKRNTKSVFLAPEREVARAGQRVLVPPGEGPAAEVRPILDRRAAAADPPDGSENPGRAPVPWTIG